MPDSITTPDEVKTRIGTLRFTDGAPDEETVRLVYDNLDFVRGVTAFLDGIPAASVFGMCRGFAEAGVGGQTVGIMEDLIDARTLILTPNSTTVYVLYCTDLETGPLVVETPQGILGFMDDAYLRHRDDRDPRERFRVLRGDRRDHPEGAGRRLPARVRRHAGRNRHQEGPALRDGQRMRAILEDAVAVANTTARAIIWSPPDGRGRLFEDRQWHTTFVGGNHEFYKDGERLLDARALFHYYAAGITPAMAGSLVGKGSQYTYSARDSEGRYLDGSKTYKITLPAPVPVNNFWSFMVYDTQSRAMLETDQRSAGLDSNKPDLVANEDGSHTVWFAPEAPEGKEGNWVQTMPGKGWHSLFRLYGPLEPWFDRTWKPGDFELVE